MASIQTDNLFNLIKTLTKAEKRSFKLYANRIHGRDRAKFVKLFDILDKQRTYDEEAIFRKAPEIKRTQLSNLKRHLYRQLLTSLRLIHIHRHVDIAIREQLDFARLLYGKGLYMQSLRILKKAKEEAYFANQDLLHLEIVEFEKLIESRHITGSMARRADELSEEAEQRSRIVYHSTRLSNLSLKLYGFYLKSGLVRNEKDAYLLEEFFKANMLELRFDSLTFFEKIYWHEVYIRYYGILQNFPMYYRHAHKWVELFEVFPEMKEKDPDLYLRGLHFLLEACFYTNNYSAYDQMLGELKRILSQGDKLNMMTRVQGGIFYYTALINKHFMQGTFTEGLQLVPELEAWLEQHELYVDWHRRLIFLYKIACLYFGSGDFNAAIDYLNQIIHFHSGTLRQDLQSYARLLHLICHYELGHYNLLEYLVKSVYRFLKRMEDLNGVLREILRFLRRELYADDQRLLEAFRKLKTTLETLQQTPYERRSFLYLDIISWLESKIEHVPVEQVVRQKFLQRQGVAARVTVANLKQLGGERLGH